jgi:hypothetical protein
LSDKIRLLLGDNIAQRATQYGAAYTQIVDSSGNFVDTFGGSGGTSSADDADFTATSTLGTIAQGVYESSPTSVTDGDVGAVGITQTRSLKVEETNSTAILADTASMDTNLGTLAGAVAAGQMQVDIVADGAGLATAANQLANGHDVTVDNGAAGAAVNIQDGGNKITVDWNGTDPPIGAGTEAAALRVTMATDSTGTMTVDGTVTANPASGTIDTVTTVSTDHRQHRYECRPVWRASRLHGDRRP